MTYYELKPDVAGQDGENMEFDPSVHPPRVFHLHVEIDNWAGDDLIENYPCYIVTDVLGCTLKDTGMSRYELRDLEVSLAPEGQEILAASGIAQLPTFRWLYVTGSAGQDDIGVTSQGRLVVSDRALDVLRQFHMKRCDVEEYVGN